MEITQHGKLGRELAGATKEGFIVVDGITADDYLHDLKNDGVHLFRVTDGVEDEYLRGTRRYILVENDRVYSIPGLRISFSKDFNKDYLIRC